jgi:hypothetical protein
LKKRSIVPFHFFENFGTEVDPLGAGDKITLTMNLKWDVGV